MGAEMRRLRLTKLLLLPLLLLANLQTTLGTPEHETDPLHKEIRASRIQRDIDENLTTVLLVPARSGKSAPPIGILSKTARTFVQDGASTEYATQVLGTTLENGRLYAKILATSSRVFYDKESLPDASKPFVVYPSVIPENNWNFKFLNETSAKSAEKINDEEDNIKESSTKEELDELKNDIFNKAESIEFKPAKVVNDDLPTYTVKQDYVTKDLEILEDEQSKSFRPRAPKIFKAQAKVSPKKQDIKPLATVTYHGFAEFVTTVGDTVIVFSPSTAPAPVGRPATTIKGDATLRPDDGIAVLKIKPTSVVSEKKTETIQIRSREPESKPVENKVKQSSKHHGLHDLQPSRISEPEVSQTDQITSPLLFVPNEKNGVQNPTGLIKVVDSTTAVRGTTTHYMSSIYGTYLGTNYAQIIHTSSNVYFHPEDSTVSYQPAVTTERAVKIKNNDVGETLPAEETTENELGNDVIPLNQGRSIKALSPKNQFSLKGQKQSYSEGKISLATRLLPSTVYKTFTYFTTFFISDKAKTTTSIKSREVVSSEITYLTELILPTTSTQTLDIKPTSSLKMSKMEVSSNTNLVENPIQPNKQDVEEIQLIFRTIFTTYTYLTTFYHNSTQSVSSRKVTATNVITQTIDPASSIIDFDQSVDKTTTPTIVPTKTADIGPVSLNTIATESPNVDNYNYYTTTEDTTENILTTLPDQITTIEELSPTEPTEPEENSDEPLILLEPSVIPVENTQVADEQAKTTYKTYTYYTEIKDEDNETEVITRTEVVLETIEPTSVTTTEKASTSQAPPPPEILAYLEALKKQKSPEEARQLAEKVQEKTKSKPSYTTEIVNEITTEDSVLSTIADDFTTMDDSSTESMLDDEVVGSMKTDVIFTSSSGGTTVLDAADKKYNIPEDQELSETNHHDVEPAPTTLLQTSYTTYTYFTTSYKGDATNVISRLETVTNIVTETIKPTAALQPETKTQQPLTYLTTFTYWTTFIKGNEVVTTSREETVTNVVTPGVTETPTVQLDVVKTYRPFVLATPIHNLDAEVKESKATSDNEVTTSPRVIVKEILPTSQEINEVTPTSSPEPVTLYTTYTYYTTSYGNDTTFLKSRLETVTSVSYVDVLDKATPRAIGRASPATQILNTEEKTIEASKVDDSPKTGLLSTIRSSEVNDGTTTHFMTDTYGTYIDGLYAQVVETSTQVELPTPVYVPSATPVLPTGILSLNKGSIVDADEVTTVHFTTKQIGSTINGLYVKITESTSSTQVDINKLSTYTPTPGHRTGLVRLVKGLIEANDTTTYYQSKVIGTSIDGRYAQIIESTSSYVSSKPTSVIDVAPTSTLPPNHATNLPAISPSPAVIQSSIADDNSDNDSDQEEHENDEEGDEKSTKKSRLTFSSRKRTSSTPPIRPFASRSRPTFNPKRKPQGATTITRSDITPTVTATLAGKGSRFSSSRGRVTSSLNSSTINPSSSRRFSGRRSSIPATSLASASHSSSRTRGSVRATPSSSYSGSRRGSTSIRGSSVRPSNRASASPALSSSRFRAGIRPSSTLTKVSSTVRQDDQEDNANEYTTVTLITEETPIQDDSEDETAFPSGLTTTESSKKFTNPLLRFRRPPAFGSGVKSTTPRVSATTTSKRTTNSPKQTASTSRTSSVKARPTVSSLTTRARQGQSSLFPPRGLFGRKPETTEAPVESKNESFEDESFEDDPVEEITDNDYEGSEQQESAPTTTTQKTNVNEPNTRGQIRPFTRIGRGRRVRRQTNQTRSLNARFRRPTIAAYAAEDRLDGDFVSSKEDFSKVNNNDFRYNSRGRSLNINSRGNLNGNKEDKSSEEYYDTTLRSRSKSTTANRSPARVKPSNVSNPTNRQFTLREKESLTAKPSFKRTGSTSRGTNLRTRNTSSRTRSGTSNRYQETTNARRSPSRGSSRGGTRNSNRRIVPSRGRLSSHEDYRDFNDFDGTITVTHYVPTEVTIPVVNNGVTEKRNIITAQPSTEVIGPDRYSTVVNSDGRDVVVLGSERTGTNFQGQLEVTKFVIHETPTTKVSHMLTSSGGRRFSQPVVVPSTIYSVENVVSTSKPSLTDNSPLANILLSQLLLGQLGQQNPLLPVGGSAPTSATPSTRYDTRATTYVTTITKHQSTVIPLTFRGKEILTTLVDSTTDVVTATELITDTVVVTPTLALPAANLNSLLLLLQQSQAVAQQPIQPLQQLPNPLLDPLLAAAPFFSQSNTLPGEVERRNQPVDFDYKPESYEDLSEEEPDKGNAKPSSTGSGKQPSSPKTDSAAESSVITLYVSGRRPGEFSTILSTVKAGEESASTKVKRDAAEPTVVASLSPSLQAASEPMLVMLAGSEEPIDAHAPTQSLESVVGDVGRHISTSIYS